MNRLMGALVALTLMLHPRPLSRDERGSVTTEHVLWAVAVITIVGIAVLAVKTYVENQSGLIP
jgi:heme/copper-type cytochrome/quinol oxidase subunit 2